MLRLSTTNSALQLGTDILLTATATSIGSSVTNIALFDGATRLAQGSTNSITFLWRPTEPRDYSLIAVATDNLGQSGASALVVIRIFSPLPFSIVAGTYTGVFFDQNPTNINLENSGLFTLKLNKHGSFTGKLAMNGAGYPFRGQFDQFGRINLPVLRRARRPIVLGLLLDLSGATQQISGSATTAAGTNVLISSVVAERNVFHSRTNPAPQAGRRSLILQPAPDLSGQSIGLDRATIGKAGTVRIHGALNDGRKFSFSTALSKDGRAPFYVSLSRGTGAIVGWLFFGRSPNDLVSGELWQLSSATAQSPAQIQIVPVP